MGGIFITNFKNIFIPIILGIIAVFIEVLIVENFQSLIQILVCTFLFFILIGILFIKIYKSFLPAFWCIFGFTSFIISYLGLSYILDPNILIDQENVYIIMTSWFSIVLVSFCTKMFLKNSNIKNFDLFFKKISILFLVLYALTLYYALFSNIGEYQRRGSSINLIPFATIIPYINGSSNTNLDIQVINILANILLFIPLGFYIFIILNLKTYLKIFIILLIPIIAECIQFVFELGVVDIDDVILNFIGGLLGAFLIFIIEKIHSSILNNNTKLLKF